MIHVCDVECRPTLTNITKFVIRDPARRKICDSTSIPCENTVFNIPVILVEQF